MITKEIVTARSSNHVNRQSKSIKEVKAKSISTKLTLPSGKYLRSRSNGIIRVSEDGEKVVVCSYIRLVAHLKDEATGNVMVKVEFKDIQNQFKIILFHPADFDKPLSLTDQLLNVGHRIYDRDLAKVFLSDLYHCKPPKKNTLVVAIPGWHNIPNSNLKAYVVNGRVFTPQGVACNIALADYIDGGFSSRGTLNEWIENVADLSLGNRRLMFLMCAGVTGPLLFLLKYKNFSIHLFGESQEGKSTALKIVGSMYGDHDFGLSWNTTVNAIQEKSKARTDSALLLDEISEGEASQVSAAAYILNNGITKSRLGSDGKLNTVAYLRLVGISNGEDSLQEHLNENGIKVKLGQLARLISIPLNPKWGIFNVIHGHSSKGDYSAKLLNNISSYYGTAGPQFIQCIVENQLQLAQELPRQVKEIEKMLLAHIKADEPTNLQRSVARSIAVVACAGELAISYEVFPWPKGDAIAAAKTCYTAWNRHEEDAENERNPAFVTIRQFFRDNQKSFLPLGQYAKTGKSNYTHEVDGTGVFLVNPECFEKIICIQSGKKAGIDALKKRRLLVLGLRGGPTRQVTIPKKPKLGKPSFYVIRSSILTAK